MTQEINDNNFVEKISSSNKYKLVDFWADWCGPCKQMSPIIDQVSIDLEEKLDVYKCNIDNSTKIASENRIRSIPTLILFDKDGNSIDTKIGLLNKESINEWILNKIQS